jgi:segregation and condensation protein A
MSNASFSVQTDTFQGPLEVLLDLIEKRKLFVSDVSLATVADDFVAYIETKRHLPVAETAQFLVIASTLLLIKSRSLLPDMSLTEEEEADIHELEKRLALYKKVKEVSAALAERIGKETLYAPRKTPIQAPVYVPADDIHMQNVFSAMQALIHSFPAFVKKPEVAVKKVISLPEMMDTLSTRIQRAVKTSFNKVADKKNKVATIVSFLALLELVRGGAINVAQKNKFSDIDIETLEVGTPTY